MTDSTSTTDRQAIMDRRQEFESLVRPQLDALYRTALRLSRNPDDANDLVQETALKAYRYFDRFERGSNIRAWLFKIMTNLYINVYRKAARSPKPVGYDEVDDMFLYNMMKQAGHDVDTAVPEKALFDQVLGKDVQKAIDELPEEFRIVVVLAFVEEMSYQEIAESLNLAMGTVKSRLHRGRKLLQKTLFDYAKQVGFRAE